MIFKTIIGNQSAEYDIDNSSTDFVLEQGTFIDSKLNGIREDDKYHLNTINIEGTVSATHSGEAGIFSAGTATRIIVGSTGFINGNDGVDVFGDHATIINNGHITGTATAIDLHSDHGKVVNNGTINGQLYDSESDDAHIVLAQGSTLTNSSGTAIFISSLAGQKTHIVNHGTVTPGAGGWGATMHDGDETLVNRGTINGELDFGGGNDVFDNRGGKVTVTGIFGGAGDDTFILDRSTMISENVGDGIDTVKSTISMSLSSNYLIGSEMENLTLLGHKNTNGTGNDLGNALTGNAGNNRLLGLGNNDVIAGGAGNDRLDGGLDTDMLTGGKGHDMFVFKTGYGQDTVTDFKNGQDHFDFKEWAAIKDFADLTHHHLTVDGDNLVIHAGADTLTLEHTTKGQLDASDFTFA